MTSQLSSDSDDVRRSIDVLDQVLSEFDDIEPLDSDDQDPSSVTSPSTDQKNVSGPPPINRSLKPRPNPPTLPKKTRKKSQESSEENWNIQTSPHDASNTSSSSPTSTPDSTSTHRSRSSKKSISEASSHEYQEISSELMNPSYKQTNEHKDFVKKQEHHLPHPQLRHRSQDRLLRGNSSYDPRSGGRHEFESPLRKSKSGEVSSMIADEASLGRGRRSGRRHVQRRVRSTDRILDHRIEPFFDPRLPETGPVDPRLIDPKFIDSRLVDPRLYDPRFVDPRLLDPRLIDPRFHDSKQIDPRFIDPLCDPRHVDPRLLDPPFFIDDTRLHFEGSQGRYPMEDPMSFPHLMTFPGGSRGPYALPPLNPLDYPHTIPPYEYPFFQDPLLSPEQIFMDYPIYPMDFEGYNPHLSGYDPRLKEFDPTLLPPNMRHHGAYPIDGQLELPLNYPNGMSQMNYPSRERINSLGNRGFPRSNEERLSSEDGWLPPTPEEARRTIQRVVRGQSRNGEEDEGTKGEFSNNKKLSKRSGNQPRLTSTGQSDSSGRSSPLDESSRSTREGVSFRSRQGSQTQKSSLPKEPSTGPGLSPGARIGAFRVGEAVRKNGLQQREFGGKETVSLPHFVSGGKDSGFDESPVVEESSSLLSPGARVGTPVGGGGGGGFVVAGVFSDSSKMYIPAPPSPTPDYDNENEDTDGGESDILQEPFYVTSEEIKKDTSCKENKNCPGSNRDSISDDSLQEGKEAKKDISNKERNSLEALMAKFHMGLPPVGGPEDGHFSDDSLEEESSSAISPSRPSTIDLRSRRPESMESLISMDGSTTSFDYMSDLHPKVLLSGNPKRNSQNESMMGKLGKSPSKIKSPRKETNEIKNLHPTENKICPKSKLDYQYEDQHLKFKTKNVGQKEMRNIKSGFNQKVIDAAINLEPSISQAASEENHSLSTPKLEMSENSKDTSHFDAIRHMIKEGLIEGLDETPPDFTPPPPIEKVPCNILPNEERADSGIGSTASTNHRKDGSGVSDNLTEKLSAAVTQKKNTGNISSDSLMKRRSSSPPPLPPPRDSSMNGFTSGVANSSNSQPLLRNQSWLYKNKRSASQETSNNHNQSHSSLEHSKVSQVKSNFISKPYKNEKITHVDNIRPLNPNIENSASITNGNISSQYASPHDHRLSRFHNNEFLENRKNLEVNRKHSDNPSLISEDQASVSSHGSRSGRFFSRLTETMKSGSRTNSPLTTKYGNQNRPKKVAPVFHGDVIRDPSRMQNDNLKPLLSPPEFQSFVSPSSAVPLTRDGSGRFRSIEDLTEAASERKIVSSKEEEEDLKKKRKKHSTLPPNLTPADMLEEEKELRRTTSVIDGKKNKEETDGSKFKFNIFRGFWRRNKYSFDKV